MSTGEEAQLASLTGLRSGKNTYYREYLRSDERLKRAVRAMDSISRGVVRTVEGPRGLLEQVARAAGSHLDASWVLLGLADGALPGARPRFVGVDPRGEAVDDDAALPADIRRELGLLRAGHLGSTGVRAGWVSVPVVLEGQTVGALVARHGLPDDPEPGDRSVLRILAGQAAVALFTSEQFQNGLRLHREARRLNDETHAQARDLAARTEQLRRAEHRLLVADQRQLVDRERHRIARELHDTVSQQVLSAGMAVDIACRDAAALGADAEAVVALLGRARDLTATAVAQLRQAIYALDQHDHDSVRSLPELLMTLTQQHEASLAVALRVEGDAAPLPDRVHHELVRAVGEALFNVVAHARATRAVVRMRYRPDSVLITVADDGVGNPVDLRRRVRLATSAPGDGRHRGLLNMSERMAELGGTMRIRRARLGGVRIELHLPLPVVERTRPALPPPQEHR